MKKHILKSTLIAMAGVGLTLSVFSTSQALTIDPTIYDGYLAGTYATSWGSIQIGPTGFADTKTVLNYTGLGVTNPTVAGDVAGEIDANEAIRFTFTEALQVTDFTILFLFGTPAYGDAVNEISVAYANGTSHTFLIGLKALQPNNYELFGTATGATVDVISAPTQNGAGVFTVNNPFGSEKVLSITFTAQDDPLITGGADSDFAIGNINVVPEPATMFLFGTGLIGLAGIGRRKKN